MCRKLIFLFFCVIVTGIVPTNQANAELVGWWRFDDGFGTTAIDSSGNGNDGTLENAAGMEWSEGIKGWALSFDGTGFVSVPAESWSSITAEFTVAFWIFGSNSQPLDGWCFGAWGGNSRLASCHIPWSDGTVYFDSGLTGQNERISKPAAANEYKGQWRHWAFVKNADTGEKKIYLDGVLWHSGTGFTDSAEGVTEFYIGAGRASERYPYTGMVDDFRLYNNALTEGEILAAMEGSMGYPYALGPYPADGALYPDTWLTLSWKAGDFAVSHDVYMGENFDDVNEATRDSDVYQANLDLNTTFYIVGFPGFPYPDGLVNGTTYYWRIDEVNDADPNSPWKGKVWNFMVPPKIAYYPNPVNGDLFVDPNVKLTWTAGFGAKLHTIYFGDDFDTVANAAGGVAQGLTTFNPGTLESGKTYYWRVDEFDITNTYTGDVWSFTTSKVGGGIRGDYYRGMNFESFVLTRTDPRIAFSWGGGEADPSVGADNFSVRWTGEVEAAFTETYTFYARADDGVRLWVDDQQLVDAWVDQSATEYSGEVGLVAGNTYTVVMEMYENGGDAVAELRWSSPSTQKNLVPQAALSPPVKAGDPRPRNRATGTKMTPILRWDAGDLAASHEVYFGIDADAVANAGKTSPEYKGTRALGDESYDPGKLAWNTTYYWRVDEVNDLNSDSPWIGNLWTFTTGDFLVIDDFEDYDAGENQIWYSWIDGLGFGVPGSDPYNPGNGTGSAVGDETTASYTEQTIVHGGRQSMPLAYDNNKQGYAKYSEAELTLIDPRDWTEEGVAELSLWFYGDSNNSAEPMYVAVSNSTGNPAVVIHDNPAVTTINTWTEWVIPLSAFSDKGIVLTNVNKIAIGLGTRGNITVPGGSGKMIFDDIRLNRP